MDKWTFRARTRAQVDLERCALEAERVGAWGAHVVWGNEPTQQCVMLAPSIWGTRAIAAGAGGAKPLGESYPWQIHITADGSAEGHSDLGRGWGFAGEDCLVLAQAYYTELRRRERVDWTVTVHALCDSWWTPAESTNEERGSLGSGWKSSQTA